jgi:hypothetical protein
MPKYEKGSLPVLQFTTCLPTTSSGFPEPIDELNAYTYPKVCGF